MKKSKDQETAQVTEEKFELKELKNYQITVLLEVYAKLYKLDFNKEEIDDAVIIADETVMLEDAIRAYGKLEKGIYQKVEDARDDKGEVSIELINKANVDLNELANKTVKLTTPLSDTIKKYISKVDKIQPKQIRELKLLGLY